MKKILLVAFVLLLVFAGIASAETHKLSLGHGTLEQHPTHYGIVKFKEIAEERSGGRLQIELFPNRQLGEEREMVEGLQMGTVDMAVVSTGPLGGFVPEINVLDLPFLFQNDTHAYGVFDGPIGRELLDKFESVGIYGAAIWENGWRNLTTNKKVLKPADLKGVKIRTMENEVHMAAFEEMGAGPVPMVWGEVYTSLQQGVIDAQENPISVIYVNNLWEVQKYVQLTSHVYGPHVFLISELTLAGLPEDLQQLVKEIASEVSTYQRLMSKQLEVDQRQKLIDNGMEVIEVDKAPFQEAVKAVYDKYGTKYGDFLERILNVAAK